MLLDDLVGTIETLKERIDPLTAPLYEETKFVLAWR